MTSLLYLTFIIFIFLPLAGHLWLSLRLHVHSMNTMTFLILTIWNFQEYENRIL